MRLVLALALALPAAGCSLLYNPNNIDKAPPDGTVPDAEVIVDADPTALVLDRVAPSEIFEGQGVGGSRPALIAVHGDNLVTGAVVELLDPATQAAYAAVTIDATNVKVAANHKMVILAVSAPVDANDADVTLDVKVTQQGGISKTLEGAVTLHGLPVLEGVAELDTATEHTYAQVTATSIKAKAGGTKPLVVRSYSSLTVTGTVDVSAVTTTPGPNGEAAGTAGPLLNPGGNGMGMGAGTGGPVGTAGGGGGFGTAGARVGSVATGGGTYGEPGLPNLLTVKSSGGGGGGGGAVLGGFAGGAGGAGGGSVELTAGGDLSIGMVVSKGGDGQTGANTGGGGSGGAIVVRAGGTAMFTGVATGGAGGGMGGNGRIRIDQAADAAIPAATPVAFRGPTVKASTDLIYGVPAPTLTLLGQTSSAITLYISGFQNDGSPSVRTFTTSAGGGSNAFVIPAAESLFRGVNNVCVEVEGAVASANRPEARNCIQIGYALAAGQAAQ